MTTRRDHHQRGTDFALTVRADRAELDRELRDHLGQWFATAWPLTVRYARHDERT